MPKVSKRVLNMFWGKFFEKVHAQCSMEGRVFENFLTNQKILKIQKCPKSFPKVSKHVLNMFWGKLFEKFLPSFPWNVESSKIFKKNNFKNPKMPKIVPKRIQTCFDCNLGLFFRKNFAQFSMEGRVFENFQKNQRVCKIPKMPKIVPKSIETCFELVLGQIFRKLFLPSVPWRLETSKNFKKKIRKVSKFQKCPKLLPKVSKRVLNMFWGKFFEKVHAQCSMEGRVFENFLTNQKILKIQKCPKSFPKVSKHVLNMFWGKLFEKFLPSFPWNVESSKIFKKK